MIVNSIADVAASPIFIRLQSVLASTPVYLKVEALNAAGSIKLKTARQIISDLEINGVLRRGSQIIESSSGNLGVALAFICAERGYPFICVSDPNILPQTSRTIAALGGRVIIVKDRDSQGGYLRTRLELIRKMVASDPTLIWTNQYANRSNPLAHYRTTAREILESFPAADWVFIGAGTTGTLSGCARYLRERSPRTRVVAVDSCGSVTFGGPPGTRQLPGIGTSLRPDIADDCEMDRLIMIPEESAVQMCRRLARQHGVLLGPSTGSVLSGIASMKNEISQQHIVVAISPDFGDRYLETLYDDDWIRTRFPSNTDDQSLHRLEEMLTA